MRLQSSPSNQPVSIVADDLRSDPSAGWWELLRDPGSLVRWVALGTIAAVLLAWTVVGVMLTSRMHETLRDEQAHQNNLARILQEQTERVIATTDQALHRLADKVRAGEFVPPDLVALANETGLAPRILVQLALIGPDARLIGSNLDPDGSKSGRLDLSSREHIQVHLAPQRATAAAPLSADGLFIGKPVLGKISGKWTIQITRRIDAADGRVLGVEVASIDPLYFEELYRGVDLGEQGGVTLMGTDRTVRARVIGGRSVGMGIDLMSAGTVSQLKGESGDYEAVSRIDGVKRVYSYRQVSGYPLYVMVAQSKDEVLAPWRSTRNMALALTSLLTVAMVAVAQLFALAVRRLEQRNQALRESAASAQVANQAKTEFLAAVSHELRTPLTSIRGFAELMEKRLEDERFRHQATLIRQSAEQLNDLLTDILDMVKLEAGSITIERRPVSLRPLLDDAVSAFRVTAGAKGLAIEMRLHDDDAYALHSDELRLRQIVNILLSNAVKFTEQGCITVEVERDGRLLYLHVSDTGPGVAPHLQDAIFERFRQGDSSVSYQHGGTGLGLALARALAEHLGGRLSLRSAPGQGARFTLTLPAD